MRALTKLAALALVAASPLLGRSSAGPEVSPARLPGEDWFFGVSALAADGSESPVSSGVPGGGFVRPAH